MNFTKLLKSLGVLIFLILIKLSFSNNVYSHDLILFVSDRDDPNNQDLYKMNPDGTEIQRLTDAPSVDNHPNLSPDGQWVVFSSDATGNFEVYKAPLDTLDDENTWVQLTNFGCENILSPNRCTPARHPEWSPDGNEIIYTAKDGCCPTTKTFVNQCCHPYQIVDDCGVHYERIHIMNSNGSNDRVIDSIALWGDCDNPVILHCGHPGFSPDGDKILFSGATDLDATDWEAFIVDWDGNSATNLQQVTLGSSYPPSSNPNPIQMTGGARFSEDGEDIYFSSTRTWKGNSQLFKITGWADRTTLPLPVSDDLRLTWHCYNDYVPHQLSSGVIVYTSDAANFRDNPRDMDIWGVNPDGSGRTNLTNTPGATETLLIADEVSWFCGLPRNLSPCVYAPRAVTIESKYLMENPFLLPDGFPGKELYPIYVKELDDYCRRKSSKYAGQIRAWVSKFKEVADDDGDGLANEDPVDGIDNDGDGKVDEDPPSRIERKEAAKTIVIPGLMPPVDEWCENCIPCDDCVKIRNYRFLPAAIINQPYNVRLRADREVMWKIFANSLPSGLRLDADTGEISGTPTTIGTSTFSVAAVDTNGSADSKDFTLSIVLEICNNEKDDDGDTLVDCEDLDCYTNEYCFCLCPVSSPKGCILGNVTNRVGLPLAGKTVRLKRIRPKRPRLIIDTVTFDDGCYRFVDLEDGKYSVRVRKCKKRRAKTRWIYGGWSLKDVNFRCKR